MIRSAAATCIKRKRIYKRLPCFVKSSAVGGFSVAQCEHVPERSVGFKRYRRGPACVLFLARDVNVNRVCGRSSGCPTRRTGKSMGARMCLLNISFWIRSTLLRGLLSAFNRHGARAALHERAVPASYTCEDVEI